MSLVMFAMLLVVGLLAGWLAGLVMQHGGYGLSWDIVLGVIGSIVASLIFQALGISPEAGLVVMAVVAFVGATIPIVVQRKIWPAVA
jgi:uncharacterized membrane protein YeaQ/YmgE (transglycosylase-associated protein family)